MSCDAQKLGDKTKVLTGSAYLSRALCPMTLSLTKLDLFCNLFNLFQSNIMDLVTNLDN